jgi:hypothetical protein
MATSLFLVGFVVPIVMIVSVVSAFPIMLLRVQRGLGSAVMAAALASALVAFALTPGIALKYLVLLLLPGFLMVEALVRGRGLRRGALWAFLLVAAEISLALLTFTPQAEAQLLAPLRHLSSAEFLADMRTRLPQENVDLWAGQARALLAMMQIVYPAALLISGALAVLVNATLLRAWLARRDPGFIEGGEFEGIRWPLGLVGLFILGGAAVVVPPLRAAGYNVLLVTAFFFAVQGLAVVAYYAHRLAGPPFLRIALLARVVINPWAGEILALVGLFDTWADFRKWADPPKAEQA